MEWKWYYRYFFSYHLINKIVHIIFFLGIWWSHTWLIEPSPKGRLYIYLCFWIKTQILVVQNDVISLYTDYVNETYQWFSIIHYWGIEIDFKNASILPLCFDWVDDNLSFKDWPYFSELKMDGRSHLFRKERTHEFWDHLVDIFTFLEEIFISLYIGCRIIGDLIQAKKRAIISFVELVE